MAGGPHRDLPKSTSPRRLSQPVAMHSLPICVLLASVCITTLFWRLVISPLFFSPLSRIPAANSLAKVSSAWILWARYHGHANQKIKEAHEKHGEIVRLSPTELSVNCIDGGVKTIYGGGFDKHSWYCLFEYFGWALISSLESWLLTNLVCPTCSLRELHARMRSGNEWSRISTRKRLFSQTLRCLGSSRRSSTANSCLL